MILLVPQRLLIVQKLFTSFEVDFSIVFTVLKYENMENLENF